MNKTDCDSTIILFVFAIGFQTSVRTTRPNDNNYTRRRLSCTKSVKVSNAANERKRSNRSG